MGEFAEARKRKSHIEFREIGRSESGKTLIVGVYNVTDGIRLGTVHWIGAWRKYVFRPGDNTVYDHGCLINIAMTCRKMTQSHFRGIKKS